jgi:DNA-binding SARP family transcriptional activator
MDDQSVMPQSAESLAAGASPADIPRHCCPFTLRLLGGFSLTIGEYRAMVGSSAQRLIALLALAEHAVTRRRAAETLWPDASANRAAANLRSALWRLQQTNRHFVIATTIDLRLSRDVVVDTHRLGELARMLLARSRPCTDTQLSDALRVDLHDDLLPDWPDEEWLHEERERFRQLRLHCLEALCERLAAVGWYGAAVDAGLAAVRADPFRESARIALVGAYLAEGNISDARRHYDCYRRQLKDELGVEPAAGFGQVIELCDVRRLQKAAAGTRIGQFRGRR